MPYNTRMLGKKLRSLGYALSGIKIAWREEFNFRLQVVCAVIVLVLGWYVGISQIEFLMVIFLIGLILTAEAFNTALEELCDKFQPTHDPHIAKIKDLAAAAVLISSSTALLIGLFIFIPHLIAFFS